MASGVPVVRAPRVVSRDPATRRATLSNRSLVAVGDDAFGQLVSANLSAHAQHGAGVLVPVEGQEQCVPMGMEDDGLDDVEEWEQSPSVPIALDAIAPFAVDAIGEFNRACQGGGYAHSRQREDPVIERSNPRKEARSAVDD